MTKRSVLADESTNAIQRFMIVRWPFGILGILAIAVAIVRIAEAEPSDPIQDFQSWNQIQAKMGFGPGLPRWSATLEGTVRRGSPTDANSGSGSSVENPMTALFLRPSMSYQVTPWLNATLGYAWAPVYFDDRRKQDVQEHRVWEQASASGSAAKFELASRTRLEERIRTAGKGQGDTELRLRQRFRVAHEIVPDSPWRAIVSTELFFFLNETDFESDPGFSENRAFAGVGYEFGSISVEFGYLNQFIDEQKQANRVNHVLSTSLTFRFGK